MSINLEDALKQNNQQVDVMPKYLELGQASEITTAQDIVNNIPKYKDNKIMAFLKGAYNSIDSSIYDTLPALELGLSTVDMAIGDYFGQSATEIERKQLNIATMQRNLMVSQQKRSEYLSPETANSWSFGLGQGAGNLLTMYATGGLAGGIAKGVGLSATKALALKSATGIATGVALENVEQQSERIPLNEQNEVDIEKLTPEWAKKSSVGTASYLTTSALLEKYVGFGKQVSLWETPIKFSSQAFKNISAVLKQAGKGMLSEGLTEGLQSLTSSGILLAEGTIKLSDMPERLKQAWKEAVIGGILGGSVGVAVSVNQQINVKKMLREEIGKVVSDPNETEQIVNAVWEAGTNEMATVISKELELSSELNAKHGTIYDNMSNAILQAIKESGAFVNESESDIAQYVSQTSKMFANQVLAEANKRGCLIDSVLKASDIAYFDGKIQLKAGDKVISETPVIADEMELVGEYSEPSLYGVAEIDSEQNKAIAEQIKKNIKTEEDLFKEYKNFRKQIYQNYKSIKDLKNQAIEAMKDENVNKYGQKSQALEDYQTLVAYENLLNQANYVENNYKPAVFYQGLLNPKDDIYQRTDKSKYLTDNEVEQLKKDKENFTNYVQKLINGELSPLTQIRVVEKLPSAYNKIPQLKGKKVVITQDVYKKIIDLPNKFKKNHNVDRERAIRLPEFLSDPLYILQSTSEGYEHRFVVVTASKNNKTSEKLSIILEPKSNTAIVSAYDETINISEEKKNNRVLYSKKEELSKTLSASKAVTIDNSNNIIAEEQEQLNPDAKIYEQSGKDITKTENFKKWFGDSKVVKNNGKPQICYHATNYDFNEFDKNKIGTNLFNAYGKGFYFTTSRSYANGFGKNLMKVYLSIKNPYIAKFGEEGLIDSNKLKAQGFDGVRYNDIWVAFEPEQIKSVENQGTFDAENPNIYYQSAYHGTPHKFDEFSLDAIGTGEGAQAHGWGLYFAENKDVSEGYRKALISNETKILYKGKSPQYIEFKNGTNNIGLLEAIIFRGKESTIKHLEKNMPFGESTNELIEYAKSIDEKQLKEVKQGQLFEVDIPESDVLLDENKPYSKQSAKVKKAIKKLFEDGGEKYQQSLKDIIKHDYTGKGIYETIRENEGLNYYSENNKFKYNSEFYQMASEKLNKYGVKGITYDGKQDGRCYVIFDDKAIKILNTFYQLKGLPKQEKVSRGAFYVDEKAIELFKDADYSTLPHELAHYWLDNMWTYTRTGNASQQYMENFNNLAEWLGIKDYQVNLTREQQEKFARGYEKYLMQGYAPNSLIQGAFEDYDKWLQRVYKSAKELNVKLTPQAIEFFDTMTTGELPEYTVEETQKEIFAKNLEEAEKTYVETQKVIVEKQAEFSNNPVNYNNINVNTAPVTSEGEQSKSSAYTKQADILGVAEELNYNKVDIEKQNKKATEFVANNLQQAERIVKGLEEAPADILKNAIFNAYLKQMLAIGNNEAYLEALRIQSLNLTRAGQEIASQRGAVENIFDSAFWIRKIENNAKIRLALQKFGDIKDKTGEIAVAKMNEYIEKQINSVLDAYLDATPEEQAKIVENLSNKITSEFKVKKKKQDNEPNVLFQTLKEPSEVRTRTNAYNYLYKVVYGDLGISLTKEQAGEVIAKTNQLQKAMETTKDKNGNPSALFFKNLSEMENYANSIQPAPTLAVLTSVVGRGNMLFSLKSLALNIESNIINFFSEATIKRVINKQTEMAVNTDVIKEYLKLSKEVYNVSGYQLSTMPELDPTQNLLSEKMISSQGEGVGRAIGRFFEQTIFKYGLGYPDLVFKDFAFVDTANLLATQYAKGDSKKATEIFKDVILVEPKTEIGKQIREMAINDALIATYQNKGTISETVLGMRNAINNAKSDLRIGDILSPFVKTPANVIGIGLDYTVGGIYAMSKLNTIINDVKNGVLTEDTKKAFRSLSRNGLGLFVAFVLSALIDDEDYIPDYALLTPKERELVKLKGGVFNSIKIGNRYYSLDYFGTLGMPLVSILNARRGKDLKEQVYNYFNGARLQAFKVPVLTDLKDLLDKTNRALNQEVDKNIEDLENWAIDFISSRTMPAIISDVAKITDEYERNTNNSAFNRFMSKLPIIREELPLVYNYGTGRPVETQNALSTLFAGARVKEEITSPVIREINRLSKTHTEKTVTISKITKAGDLSKLSDVKKQNIEREFAKRYSKEVKTLLTTYEYKKSDNETKVKLINKVRENIKNDIKKQYGLKKRGKK